jgi:hypothetical protein
MNAVMLSGGIELKVLRKTMFLRPNSNMEPRWNHGLLKEIATHSIGDVDRRLFFRLEGQTIT